MIGKINYKRLFHIILFLFMVSFLSVVVIRFQIERVEQKQCVIIRTGTDKEVFEIAKCNHEKGIVTIKNFSWNDLESRKNLFVSNYAYYARCISSGVTLAVNKDKMAIPHLKLAIQKYHENPTATDRYIYELFVWSLFFIDGKQSLDWYETSIMLSEIEQEDEFNVISKYCEMLLWLEKDRENDRSIPEFVSRIRVNRFDQEWPSRFYQVYCDHHNLTGFKSAEEWAVHILQQDKNGIIDNSDLLFYEMFNNSCHVMYNELTKTDHFKKTIRPISFSGLSCI